MRQEWGEPPSQGARRARPGGDRGRVDRAGLPRDDQRRPDVAVKVQYPGIAEAVDADLRAARALVPLIKRLSPGLNGKALVEELRERISEELDYELEAANGRRIARAWRDHPHVLVPRVDTELSTRRVLVTDWVDGDGFGGMKELPDAERDRLGETIFRFFFASAREHGVALGDPHPGNFLRCRADGRLVALDFGLVRALPRGYIEREARDLPGARRAGRRRDRRRVPRPRLPARRRRRGAAPALHAAHRRVDVGARAALPAQRRLRGRARPRRDGPRPRVAAPWSAGFDVPPEALLLRRM